MTHSIQEIIAKINALPESMQQEQPPALTRKAGALAGRIKISDDFNAPLADFAEYEK